MKHLEHAIYMPTLMVDKTTCTRENAYFKRRLGPSKCTLDDPV